MAIVGPGTQVNQEVSPDPLLNTANEYEVITILNPLTDDFQVRVAQEVPINMPMEIRSKTGLVQSERDVVTAYGLDLKNPDHKAFKYIYNDTVIPAGKTMNFRGNDAQVVVRQLVNEIMQREGNKRMMADPNARNLVEQRIIQHRGSIQDLMDTQLKSPRQQINEAVTKSNEVQNDPFPGLSQAITSDEQRGQDIGTDNPAPQKRSPGRPAKAQSIKR